MLLLGAERLPSLASLIPPPERLEAVEGVDSHTDTASGMYPLCVQNRVNSTAYPF